MEGWDAFKLTIGGVLIGWLLNQVSSWWSQRSERQRVYRRILFYLLQLEWIFQRMDVSEFIDHYIERLKELKVLVLLNEEQEDNVRLAMYKILAKQALRRSDAELKSIEEGYKRAVEDLSHLSPFLAFQLEGRTSLVQRLEEAQDLVGDRVSFQSMMEGVLLSMHPSVSSQMSEVRRELSSIVDDQLPYLKDVLDDHQQDQLDDDIEMVQDLQRKIAIRIGPLTWFKTRAGYREAGRMPQEEQDELNAFIDDVVEALTDAKR